MSDITKKVFSIESDETAQPSKTAKSYVLRPILADDKTKSGDGKNKEDVPAFITREAVNPISSTPPMSLNDEINTNPRAAGWLIFGLGLLYLIGAGLYFGAPLLEQPLELFSIAGLIVLLALPVMLLFLLWRAFRHLGQVNLQNARFAKAADVLVNPDSEALKRTKTLAAGIRSELSNVTTSFSHAVDALKDVHVSVTQETQSINDAGRQLTSRSDDVGRNLTLQRQALEAISNTFDTRMDTLSNQISGSSENLNVICTTAEERLLKASEALQLASGKVNQTVADGSNSINERITEINALSVKLEETSKVISSNLETSTQALTETDKGVMEKTLVLQELNTSTRSKITDLQKTIDEGNKMVAQLRDAAETRKTFIQSYYQDLSAGLKQSENEALATQGKTARMVELNLGQMSRHFANMETELHRLQSNIDGLKSQPIESSTHHSQQPRLNLQPLESDFPPVEPPRFAPALRPSSKIDIPMNLGMDMEIKPADEDILAFEPDVIRRPGNVIAEPTKGKGFGRRVDKQDKSGWRWRDMLGTLDRPDTNQSHTLPNATAGSLRPSEKVDGVAILTMLRLSPSAIIDEGTVVDAAQAFIHGGETELVMTVSGKLPEAINHLKDKMTRNPELPKNLTVFCNGFAQVIRQAPPTAPALRAALGSPDGRAYLLAVTALKG